jgi:hypothetical protein
VGRAIYALADLTRSNAMGGVFVGADEIPAELF